MENKSLTPAEFFILQIEGGKTLSGHTSHYEWGWESNLHFRLYQSDYNGTLLLLHKRYIIAATPARKMKQQKRRT